jgi:hypothetical protein
MEEKSAVKVMRGSRITGNPEVNLSWPDYFLFADHPLGVERT